jgi:hypothetical protein
MKDVPVRLPVKLKVANLKRDHIEIRSLFKAGGAKLAEKVRIANSLKDEEYEYLFTTEGGKVKVSVDKMTGIPIATFEFADENLECILFRVCFKRQTNDENLERLVMFDATCDFSVSKKNDLTYLVYDQVDSSNLTKMGRRTARGNFKLKPFFMLLSDKPPTSYEIPSFDRGSTSATNLTPAAEFDETIFSLSDEEEEEEEEGEEGEGEREEEEEEEEEEREEEEEEEEEGEEEGEGGRERECNYISSENVRSKNNICLIY